jgi:hypothetical protein
MHLTYARYQLQNLNPTGFARHLEQARWWSMDMHAGPYLQAAEFLFALPGDHTAKLATQLDAAMARHPYSAMVYQLKGQIAKAAGQDPLPDWRRAMTLDPRSGPLRLLLLNHYAQNQDKAAYEALLQETIKWQELKNTPVELRVMMRQAREK